MTGTHRSPFRSVWFDPSRTIARIAHENPGYRLYVLPVLAGLAVWPTYALFSTEASETKKGLLLSTLVSFGPAIEVLQVFIGAYLIRVTGAWLGGGAGVASIQVAIAWGNVPIVALAILGLPLMAIATLYAASMGAPLSAYQSPLVTTVGFVLLALQIVMVAWSFGIFWKGLAVVQGFSVKRAALNSIVAWVIPAALVAIGVVAFGYADRLSGLFFTGIDELVTLRGQ